MSDRPTLRQAAHDLRSALRQEVEQLDRDVYFAQQRKQMALAGDLSRLRSRIRTLIAALDRAEQAELRRDDYKPGKAA